MDNFVRLKPISLTPLAISTLEALLNSLLFRDQSMKAARSRLMNKVLRIEFNELKTPLLLIFSDHQIDVLNEWAEVADCTVKANFSVFARLRDRQQLSSLMLNGDLIVEGDIQVVHQLVTLLDLAEWDPTEYLVPYLGDIAAETLGRIIYKSRKFLTIYWRKQQRYCAEIITEEVKMVPSSLELAWFNEEVDAISCSTDILSARVAEMETTR